MVYHKMKRELLLCKSEQTIITQNENLVHPRQFWVSFCEFTQLYTTDILFSAWDKSCDPAAKQAIAKYNGGKKAYLGPKLCGNSTFALDRAISEP